jgi:hypothetical protein
MKRRRIVLPALVLAGAFVSGQAVALQKADGGKLTPEHRDQLNQRLSVLRDQACRAGYAGC